MAKAPLYIVHHAASKGFANLEWLDHNYNRLSGEISPEQGNLANQWELWLDRDQLRGCVPQKPGTTVSRVFVGRGQQTYRSAASEPTLTQARILHYPPSMGEKSP